MIKGSVCSPDENQNKRDDDKQEPTIRAQHDLQNICTVKLKNIEQPLVEMRNTITVTKQDKKLRVQHNNTHVLHEIAGLCLCVNMKRAAPNLVICGCAVTCWSESLNS